ncbi:MAG: amidase family protein [Actinomycetota bacterium]
MAVTARFQKSLPALATACIFVAGLTGTGVAPATAGGEGGEAKDCLGDVAGVDLQSATILDLQRALESGRLTSRRLVAAYLDRIAAYDPKLNSIRELNPNALALAGRLDRERGAGDVRGPLHGIPLLLKDNVNTTDMPTTAGSIALKGSVPAHEAFITSQLERAGAIILGKANLSEFAGWVSLSMPPGYSSLGGQVVNPYNGASPSGSSSGSGVAGTMAFAAGTVGTETSGSILSPSDANSAVGIKTTVGLVSRAGILPLAPSFDTPGPITRNVTDAAVMLSAMAGVDPNDPKTEESKGQTPKNNDYTRFLKTDALKEVRLGYSEEDRDDLADDARAIFDRALEDLEKQGATLVPTDLLYWSEWVGLTEIAAVPNEFKASLNQYLADETSDKLRVRTLTDIIEYNRAHPEKVKYGQNLLEASDLTLGNMNEPTAIANRTAAIQGARAAIDATLIANDLDAIVVVPGNAYANVSASAGYPTVIVPAGYTGDGRRPLGLSFLASAYDEPQLISYAYDYEQATHRRVPATEVNVELVAIACG